MKIIDDIARSNAFIQIRRDIHAHPELGYEEKRTSDLVAQKLEEWGIEVHRGLATTGVVGTLRRGSGDRVIGLRADMDALPIHEANQFEHRSRNPGIMHACGHDGHTTMLLAAAWQLARAGDFDGTVRFIFQPAEERGLTGARVMIEEGLFEKFPCDAVFGIHNMPGHKVGTFHLTDGPLLASSNKFRITVKGKGGHAAHPDWSIDPVFATGQILSGLQSIITRNRDPRAPAVLSVTQIHGGDAENVIPDTAWLGGTVRTFSMEVLELVERRLRAIATSTAQAYECGVDVHFERCSPPTINHAKESAFAADVMAEIVGNENVDRATEPLMGSEDFAFMLRARPGCYAFLGNGEGDHRDPGHGGGPCLVHSSSYDFNDAIIPIGATYFVRLAERYLA
jgi:hippurate hydrolase